MPQENDATFTPDFMRKQLKIMADIEKQKTESD